MSKNINQESNYYYRKLLSDDSSNSSKRYSSFETQDNRHNERLAIHIEEDDELTLKGCCYWLGQRFFTKDKLKRRFPILQWLPKYSFTDFKYDLIAGLSVAFTIVPQGLALAVLAGLPPQYGLYTSFMGCFVYALLGSCKDMAVGPTSITAIIVAPYVLSGGVPYSILLSFLAGFIQLVFGILNLGFIVDFISFPVISSFSSAAALTIAASQLKGFFGLHYSASRFPDTIVKFFANFSNIKKWDAIMGVICMSFLIPVQLLKDNRLNTQSKFCLFELINSLWLMLSTCRNAIVVIVGAIIAHRYSTESDGNLFTLTGEITTGLPQFKLPPFSIHSNATDTNFENILKDLSTGAIVVALLGLMECVAVAKAFNTKKLDATQEMIALGVSNIFGSFFGAFPATGSFSRSAVNHVSGVRTPFGGIITGCLVLAALSTLGSYFEYIPQTVLASIIITAVIFMLRPYDPLVIWQTNKTDLLPYITTFVSCLLFGLEYGIVVGVCSSLVILLYQMARPKVFIVRRVTTDGFPFLYVKPDRSVFFPSIEYMKVKISKEIPENYGLSSRIAVVIDGEHMYRADSTFAMGIKNMTMSLRMEGVITIFYNLRKSVYSALYGISIPDNEFYHCRTQYEVYSMIKSHMNAKILTRSQSFGENILNKSIRLNWASHSVEAF